jgi:hypothetical protein
MQVLQPAIPHWLLLALLATALLLLLYVFINALRKPGLSALVFFWTIIAIVGFMLFPVYLMLGSAGGIFVSGIARDGIDLLPLRIFQSINGEGSRLAGMLATGTFFLVMLLLLAQKKTALLILKISGLIFLAFNLWQTGVAFYQYFNTAPLPPLTTTQAEQLDPAQVIMNHILSPGASLRRALPLPLFWIVISAGSLLKIRYEQQRL